MLSEAGLLMIEQECGVKSHPSQAWRILRQLGWSCQHPVGRTLEPDEEKIRQWKQQRWPEVKKRAQKERRTTLNKCSDSGHCGGIMPS
jgi:Winged helix-turn helix